MTEIPILYSLHNCPYALRARIAIYKAQQQVLIRSVKLNNKPQEMLHASPKGSVPVLVVTKSDASNDEMVLDESLEVMLWALSQNDPENLLHSEQPNLLSSMVSFIAGFEHDFVPLLNAYSSAKRYHDNDKEACRLACEVHLKRLNDKLAKHPFLFSNQESLADIAILPFLRKFARIEKQWFRKSPYPNLRDWLNRYLNSPMFSKVMENHEFWLKNRKNIIFGRAENKI